MSTFSDHTKTTKYPVTRARSHAEFPVQEIGREIHLIGSKANNLLIPQRVIKFKNELQRAKKRIPTEG